MRKRLSLIVMFLLILPMFSVLLPKVEAFSYPYILEVGISYEETSVPLTPPITMTPEGHVRLWYHLYNPNSYDVDVILGASIQIGSNTYDDPVHDKLVTLKPGDSISWPNRWFYVPSGVPSGSYTVLYGLWASDWSVRYDLESKPGWIDMVSSVSVQLSSSPSNVGTITWDGVTYSLPKTVHTTVRIHWSGTDNIHCTPPAGYEFDHWEAGGDVDPWDEYSQWTNVDVDGSGSLTAVFISINDPPVLSDGYVDPTSGDTSTIFSYYVTYDDPEDDNPTQRDVVVDGSFHQMTMISHSGTTRVYRCQLTLSEGTHNYYFKFSDGLNPAVRLPPSGTYSGPTVSGVNDPPVLSDGYVDPTSGDTSTIFSYYVTYDDPEDDNPTQRDVVVDGSFHQMTMISHSGTTRVYRCQLTLSEGTHNYYFKFSDGLNPAVRLPPSGTYSGPTVTPEAGSLYIRLVSSDDDLHTVDIYVDDEFWDSLWINPRQTSYSEDIEVSPGEHTVEIRWHDDDTDADYERSQTKQVNSGDRVEFEFDIVASFWATGENEERVYRYIVNATLAYESSHSYIYVEEGVSLSSDKAIEIADEFDTVIYDKEYSLFGSPDGILGDIDGDFHFYILVHDATAYGNQYLGMFWILNEHEWTSIELMATYFLDVLSAYFGGKFIELFTNEKEMLYIDDQALDDWFMFKVAIAHEFNHLIEYNYDPLDIFPLNLPDEKWVKEGLAMYAMYAVYHDFHGSPYVDSFLLTPDTPLTEHENRLRDYGAGYLFFLYLWEIMEYAGHDGDSIIRSILQDTANGISGIDNNLPSGYSFETMFSSEWIDWTIANYYDADVKPFGYDSIDIKGEIRDDSPLHSIPHSGYLQGPIDSVNQWAADYVRFSTGDSHMEISFYGIVGPSFEVKVVLTKDEISFDIIIIPLSENQGSITIEEANEYAEILLVVIRKADSYDTADYYYTVETYTPSLTVTAESPVNLLVTAPNGLRVGYDSMNDSVVNEIEGAAYSGPGTEPQVIEIPNALEGTYVIDAYGTGTGAYTVTMSTTAPDGAIIDTVTWIGTAEPEEWYTKTVELEPDGTITLQDIWIAFVPSPDQVTLEFRMDNKTAFIDATITFPDPLYNISDWGTPVKDDHQISADSEIWDWTGVAPMVITPMSHTYDVGHLAAGTYTFTFKAWGETVESITFAISYGVEISIDPLTTTVEPDSTFTYTIYIHNNGTVQDTYNLTLQGLNPTWYSLPQTQITLDPCQNETIDLTISPPHTGMILRNFLFTVTATSQTDPTILDSADATLTVDFTPVIPVTPEGGLAVAVRPKVTTTTAGSTLVLDILILNNENFDDVIDLNLNLNGIPSSYQADLSWMNWTSLRAFIPAGTSFTVHVEVAIPDGTSTGYKIFKIQATSESWTKGFAQDMGIIEVIH